MKQWWVHWQSRGSVGLPQGARSPDKLDAYDITTGADLVKYFTLNLFYINVTVTWSKISQRRKSTFSLNVVNDKGSKNQQKKSRKCSSPRVERVNQHITHSFLLLKGCLRVLSMFLSQKVNEFLLFFCHKLSELLCGGVTRKHRPICALKDSIKLHLEKFTFTVSPHIQSFPFDWICCGFSQSLLVPLCLQG